MEPTIVVWCVNNINRKQAVSCWFILSFLWNGYLENIRCRGLTKLSRITVWFHDSVQTDWNTYWPSKQMTCFCKHNRFTYTSWTYTLSCRYTGIWVLSATQVLLLILLSLFSTVDVGIWCRFDVQGLNKLG